MGERDDFFKIGLKKLRKELKLTQPQLAEKARVNRVTISQIETGARPASLESQWLLAEALSTTPEGIMKAGGYTPSNKTEVGIKYESKPPSIPTEPEQTPPKLHVTPDTEQDITHECIISRFKNKELAKEMNWYLLELERLSPDKFETAREVLKAMYEGAKQGVEKITKKASNDT